jgi:hypothetical protein
MPAPAKTPPPPAAAPDGLPEGYSIHTAGGTEWRVFHGGQALGATGKDRVGARFASPEDAIAAARRAAGL